MRNTTLGVLRRNEGKHLISSQFGFITTSNNINLNESLVIVQYLKLSVVGAANYTHKPSPRDTLYLPTYWNKI